MIAINGFLSLTLKHVPPLPLLSRRPSDDLLHLGLGQAFRARHHAGRIATVGGAAAKPLLVPSGRTEHRITLTIVEMTMPQKNKNPGYLPSPP